MQWARPFSTLPYLEKRPPKNHIIVGLLASNKRTLGGVRELEALCPLAQLLMEGFLEANQVVEISLSKLATTRVSGDLPLRKTLLVTKVFNKAQDMATSVQDCLLSSPHTNSNRCTSKLLASFGHNQSNIDDLPASHHRMPKPSRQQSPIAVECHQDVHLVAEQLQSGEEPMDFHSVTSFLGDILDSDNGDTQPSNSQQTVLEDVSNLRTLPLDNWFDEADAIGPVSPGKRNYQQAFPFSSQSLPQGNLEDMKRFKSCSEVASPLDSLPSFCGYLSSQNLQTAPFITYMFGRGFSHPDSDTCDDWPITHHMTSELMAPLKNLPILAF